MLYLYCRLKLENKFKKHLYSIQQNENIPPSTNLTEENCDITLIQCPEDPDVLVRPLQVYGIDETKYKDIDFTVPHIGKKRIVTPRQFYVQMDDSGFDFVKKDTKRKNN